MGVETKIQYSRRGSFGRLPVRRREHRIGCRLCRIRLHDAVEHGEAYDSCLCTPVVDVLENETRPCERRSSANDIRVIKRSKRISAAGCTIFGFVFFPISVPCFAEDAVDFGLKTAMMTAVWCMLRTPSLSLKEDNTHRMGNQEET